MLHVIPQILASLTNPMPEFRLGLVIDHRATGHPGQKFRHIRADTGNPRQRSAMTAQLSHQTAIGGADDCARDHRECAVLLGCRRQRLWLSLIHI